MLTNEEFIVWCHRLRISATAIVIAIGNFT